ncbi:MAG TPA: carboxylesterase/lipase family protein [Candidatus Anoxymicrobiaceae bacterium]
MRFKRVSGSFEKTLVILLVAALCAGLALAGAGCGTNSVASTKLGKVEGRPASNGVLVFKGMPFAAPPVGDLRFMPPQPAKPWSGTHQAFAFGKAEAQPPDALTGESKQAQSENCLTLNVWTPGLDNTKRPVMVWIHGGGFTNGSGSDSIYDGANLSKRGDTVIVTINYRLGPFGFLYLGNVGGPRYAQSGNLGLLDQLAAIRWVRDNARAFGGDPGRITVFGESAGSISISALLGMPAARGLFNRAIAESGAANLARSTQSAEATTARFMQIAGVSDIAGLRSLTTSQMVSAEAEMKKQKMQAALLFGPVIDGSAVPQPPLDAIEAGSASGVDLLIGTNLNEINLWTLATPAVARFPLSVVSAYIPIVQSAISLTSPATPEAVAASYKSRRPAATDGEVSLAAITDSMFRVPAIRVAEAQSPKQSKTWMYLFTWPSPVFSRLGACHAIELPFVFGNMKASRISTLIGRNPPQRLVDTMQSAWLAFAKNGNPNASGVPEWQAYDAGSRATMILNATSKQQDNPYGADTDVWNGVPFNSVKPSL